MQRLGIFVVDDSPRWVHQLKDLAEEIDLEVLGSASSPREAMEALNRLRPPILILDMYLEGGSGLEVLEALQEQHKATQVVVVTGSPSEQLRKACSNLGARYFLDKSLEPEGIGNALNALKAEYSK